MTSALADNIRTEHDVLRDLAVPATEGGLFDAAVLDALLRPEGMPALAPIAQPAWFEAAGT